ncbi:hypothetical protein H0H92_008337 [Tricholoma furcatifolium]|nr:hypothetical protein H0H92_008337 [Tricholoma furcatifolium]
MPISPVPALFVGLGARIALDYFTRAGEAAVKDFILLGVWQGVGLHYASKNIPLAIAVGCGIAAKLLLDFNLMNDISRTVTTLLGVALGVLCTEFLSQFFGSSPSENDSDRRRKKVTAPTKDHSPRRERLVQFQSAGEGDGSDSRHRAFRETVHTISDITSVDSHSEMIGPSAFMTPLEIEIKTLRARAALADSERRRCKEEKKWAISQGNLARASQMRSQVKHYTTLMDNFNHEADLKSLQVPKERPRHNTAEPKSSSSKLPVRSRRESVGAQPNGPESRSVYPSKIPTRPRGSFSGPPNAQEPQPSSSKPLARPRRESPTPQPNGQVRGPETRRPSKQPRP